MITAANNDNRESPPTSKRPEWGGLAVRLLQGVVYADESPDQWELLLRARGALAEYVDTIGLSLIVDEADAMAYLRPASDLGDVEEQSFPRLFRRQPLSYDATLLCVLLREELVRFEDLEIWNARCVVQLDELFHRWSLFFPADSDAIKLHRNLLTNLRRLEEIKLVRSLDVEQRTWEVRRIIKARVPMEALTQLRDTLRAASTPSESQSVSEGYGSEGRERSLDSDNSLTKDNHPS